MKEDGKSEVNVGEIKRVIRKHMKTSICKCLLLLCVTVGACTDTEKEAGKEDNVSTVLLDEKNDVSVMTLKRQTFSHELVSNGKIVARNKVDLRFESSEIVEKIYVKNGDVVRKGQKLAELDKFNLHNQLLQAADALERAKLELQDVLIGQGYAIDEFDNVPPDVMKLAKVKSGYEQNLAIYELAEFELKQAVLTAPFDGIVANLFGKQYNLPDNSEPFCRILSSESMEVSFKILESELPLLHRGDRVEILPFSSAKPSSGSITEINPLVDENGMVGVKASIASGSGLFDGMNVRVSVKRTVPDQFVVPKTAVVLRSGKPVMFTYKDGKALWNYVQTGMENMTEYTISGEELEEGMQVIVSGNMNLAHETPVRLASGIEN